MNKLDYNKILEVKKLNVEQLDENTLLFDSIVVGKTIDLDYNEEGEIYLNIEVWTDENNALKIVEIYPDGNILSDTLPDKHYKHIKKLVENATDNNIEGRFLK